MKSVNSLHSIRRTLSVTLVLAATIIATGCASTRSIPITVQSEPLGAYVMYKVKSPIEGTVSDWIFLGNTPIDVRRDVSTTQLKKAEAFVLRVMKDGYIDQQKEWNGRQVLQQSKDKGRIFWNPRLISAQ